MTGLRVGDTAPPFCLPDPDGRSICLSDFIGRFVIVYFYPKDGTPGCTREAREFSGVVDELAENDVTVLGISKDTPESHMRFREKNGLKVTLLSDVEAIVLGAYGVWGEKKMYGKSFLGITRSTFLIGPEGDVEAAWYKVKVPGHVEEVMSKLSQIMSPV